MRLAIYARTSTLDQERGLEAQLAALRDYAAGRGARAAEFADQASGAKARRGGLDALLAAVHHGEVDAVVVVKLDRLARSVRHLCDLAADLEARGVALVVLDQGGRHAHQRRPLPVPQPGRRRRAGARPDPGADRRRRGRGPPPWEAPRPAAGPGRAGGRPGTAPAAGRAIAARDRRQARGGRGDGVASAGGVAQPSRGTAPGAARRTYPHRRPDVH